MTKKTTVTGTRSKIATSKAPTARIAADRIPARGRTATDAVSGAPEPPSASSIQLKTYEEAVSLFSQSRLPEALQRFLDAAKGPAPHISDKARSYAQVCERRTANFDLKLHTAEDHFNYGVERLNARDVERAKDHLGRALKLQPDAEHILYTIALCCGLAGDSIGACENLKRAIDLEPRNRILARQDPEFAALAAQLPALRALLAGD
jgi:tetratricopeptide (TPR) repeat protein